MALTYADLGASVFGEALFTPREFARRTGSRRAAKTLSELKTRGVVTRAGRGSYRFLRPAERPDLRESEWNRIRGLIHGGPDPKTWSGPTAVELWTGGGYSVASSPYLRTLYVAVPASKRRVWTRYLSRHGVSARPRKRIGVRVVLEPKDKISMELLDGEPVPPRREVVRMIREHPVLYADAEEFLVDRPG
jgi:hypothetical protein